MSRTTVELPADHPNPRRRTADHYRLAEQMRAQPGVWVLICEPTTRRAALEAKRRIKSGLLQPYRRGGFTAEVCRSVTGRLEVWGQHVGGGR
jgi:hypothetical protein